MNPIFHETFTFGHEFDLRSGLSPTLKVEVFHKLNGAPIGSLEISLDGITNGVASWYRLEKSKGMPSACGSVCVFISTSSTYTYL